MFARPAAIVLLLSGLMTCVAGYRLLKYVLALLGLVGVFLQLEVTGGKRGVRAKAAKKA